MRKNGIRTPENCSISILDRDPVKVSGEGRKIVLDYIVDFPVEDGYVDARSFGDWISFTTFNPVTMEAIFEIEKNTDTVARSSDIILSYIYDAGTSSVSDTVSILQSGAEEPYDCIFEATYFIGEYFGGQYGNNGEINYSLILADATGSGYEVQYTTFTSGTITVSYENGACKHEADLVDNSGRKHWLTYSGSGIFDVRQTHSRTGYPPGHSLPLKRSSQHMKVNLSPATLKGYCQPVGITTKIHKET